MASDRSGELGEGRLVRRIASGDRLETALVSVERREPFRGRGVPLVGEIVRGAREPIDRHDGPAERLRNQERCDGEIFVMSDGHA